MRWCSAPLYHSVILLRQQSSFLSGYPQLLAQPSALRSRLALPTNRARTVAGRRRNPLATRTLQHEPSDKNKRSSNATGRREADAAAAQMRCRERAARNSHEGEEDRKPDILSPNFSLGILHFMPLLLNFRSLYRSQKYSLYFYLKSFNKL